jgi:hypothetical protein
MQKILIKIRDAFKSKEFRYPYRWKIIFQIIINFVANNMRWIWTKIKGKHFEGMYERFQEILALIESSIQASIYPDRHTACEDIPWREILNMAWGEFKKIFKPELIILTKFLIGIAIGIAIGIIGIIGIIFIYTHWTGITEGVYEFFFNLKHIIQNLFKTANNVNMKNTNCITITIKLDV